jgi:hypothetical protein
LQSNIIDNGRSVMNDIRSAVLRKTATGMSVELTSAAGYCEILQNKGCPANGDLLVTFSFTGTSPGDYPTAVQAPQEPNSVQVFTIGVGNNCLGPGLGLDTGDVKVTMVDLAPGGAATLTANLSSAFTGTLSGTVRAPYCAISP